MTPPLKKSLRKQYAVVWCHTGQPLYIGPSMDAVAVALEPGTTYGSGPTKADALTEAKHKARKAYAAQKRSAHAWSASPSPRHKNDPTPEQIAERAREVREQGFMSCRGEWRDGWGSRWDYSNE